MRKRLSATQRALKDMGMICDYRPRSRCFVIDVDGVSQRIQGNPKTPEDIKALQDIVRTVRALTPEQIEAMKERR